MFLCQFFKGNANFDVTETPMVISRVQVNNENGNPRDQHKEQFIFFKYACDTCSYANFSIGIRISRLQGWQRPYRGSRWTLRSATLWTWTGSSSLFYNKHMTHVCMIFFQGESKFWCYKTVKGHLEGLGEQRERQPQAQGQGVVHF